MRRCPAGWACEARPRRTAMLHFWLLIVQSLSPWRREQLLHSGPWLGCAGRPARLSARPSACPAVGAASSSPSRCPQALPGWAQESVFTNTVHTAPWAPQLCPEDVRPRAPGGRPGARLSAAQGALSLAGCSPARQQPGEGLPASRHRRRHWGLRGPREALSKVFLAFPECLLNSLSTHCPQCLPEAFPVSELCCRRPCRRPDSWTR